MAEAALNYGARLMGQSETKLRYRLAALVVWVAAASATF